MEETTKLQIEQSAIDALLQRGLTFEVERKSILKSIFRKKTRVFKMQQLYLGTLIILADKYLKLNIDEDQDDNATNPARLAPRQNAQLLAEILAIAVLNSKWKIKLFSGILSKYFLWRVTPQQLLSLTLVIHNLSNTQDFLYSIRLSKGSRITKPKADLIEERSKVSNLPGVA